MGKRGRPHETDVDPNTTLSEGALCVSLPSNCMVAGRPNASFIRYSLGSFGISRYTLTLRLPHGYSYLLEQPCVQ